MVRSLLESYETQSVLSLNCDEPRTREALSKQNLAELQGVVADKKTVFIDEAQRVSDIGLTVKLLVDQLPEIQIILTGSSSLELVNEINEPLTGRKFSFKLYPVSVPEYLGEDFSYFDFEGKLEQLLRFGSYPEVLTLENYADKEELVRELSGDLLFKDILSFQKIKSPSLLRKLFQALAFQVDSQVSYGELASTVGLDRKTVESILTYWRKIFLFFDCRHSQETSETS